MLRSASSEERALSSPSPRRVAGSCEVFCCLFVCLFEFWADKACEVKNESNWFFGSMEKKFQNKYSKINTLKCMSYIPYNALQWSLTKPEDASSSVPSGKVLTLPSQD